MNSNLLKLDEKALPDFNLLITRLEQQIVKNENQDQIRRILQNQSIQRSLNIDNRIKWASLAQMAGETEIACEIFADINKTAPEVEEAWRNHLDLLYVLNKPEAIARVLALAKKNVDEKRYREWVQTFSISGHTENEDDIEAATRPFDMMRYRRESLGRYLELFSGREDCFARQWVDRNEKKQGYVPIRRPMEHQDIEDHLKGTKTYGMYLLRTDGSVKTGVIDVDLAKQFREKKAGNEEKNQVKRELYFCIERICELSERAGFQPPIEFSGGKGYHFWYFFNAPVSPEKVRLALESIRGPVAGDISTFGIEVFPKQDYLKGKGLGNLVKLPLGIHRLTGKRSHFIKCNSRSIEAQLDFLSGVKAADRENLEKMEKEGRDNKVFIHPRWEEYAKSFPELHTLEIKCPPLAQIISACRNGKNLSAREEKIIFQTIGFLPRSKTLVHHLLSTIPDYNSHLVDYKLSRVRGTPLGCRRIHSLLNYMSDLCALDQGPDYQHPLLHLLEWKNIGLNKKSEKLENLSDALENLKTAIITAQKFLEL